MEAMPEELVARGVVPSSEVLAALLPSLTGHAIAAAISDVALRRVYWATYTAFRRRRSLLLLSLQSQVKLRELPWVDALEPWLGGDAVAVTGARTVLAGAVTLAIRTFPHTQLPNPLVKELRALTVAAKLQLPLVEELAADIFMGAFAESFVRSGQAAAALLQGTLYERYFGIDYARVLALDDLDRSEKGTPFSPGFAKLCEGMTGPEQRNHVARNGQVIEQAHIITTHNLAALVSALELRSELQAELPLLARRCFDWICSRQRKPIADRHAMLHNHKNCAYAWRQMIFYLALADTSECAASMAWMLERLGAQPEHARTALGPFVRGLSFVHEGGRLDSNGRSDNGRRWLGWAPLPAFQNQIG